MSDVPEPDSKNIDVSSLDGIDLFEAGLGQEALPKLRLEASAETPHGLATLYLAAVETRNSRDTSAFKRVVEELQSQGTLPPDLIAQVYGAILFDAGEVEAGVEKMRQAVALNFSRKNIIVLATRIDKVPEYQAEALPLYDELLRSDPTDYYGLIGRATCLVSLKELTEAKVFLDKAVELYPNDATIQYELGNLLAMEQDYWAAIERFRRAIDWGYWKMECAWAGLAYCLYRRGPRHCKEALQCVDRSLKFSPEYEYAVELRRDVLKVMRPFFVIKMMGILAVILGVLGLLYNGFALPSLFDRTQENGRPYFFLIALILWGISSGLCAMTLMMGGFIFHGRTHLIGAFSGLMKLEVLFWVCLGLFWLVPGIGNSIAAATGLATGGLVLQLAILFPLWVPGVMMRAARKIKIEMEEK